MVKVLTHWGDLKGGEFEYVDTRDEEMKVSRGGKTTNGNWSAF